MRSFALVVAVVGMGSGVALAEQQAAPAPAPRPPEQHVRGEVTAVKGDTVEVKTKAGDTVKFTLGGRTRVNVLTKADLSAIGKNAYVGTTAVAQADGTLRALEVHLFPDAARGTGEGHRPWDLQAGSSMTNATVSGLGSSGGGSSTMTNATVADATKANNGLKLSLRYQGGEQTVVVPSGTPVVKMEPADRSKIVPGSHVFAAVIPQSGGALVADRVFVGKDVVPPM